MEVQAVNNAAPLEPDQRIQDAEVSRDRQVPPAGTPPAPWELPEFLRGFHNRPNRDHPREPPEHLEIVIGGRIHKFRTSVTDGTLRIEQLIQLTELENRWNFNGQQVIQHIDNYPSNQRIPMHMVFVIPGRRKDSSRYICGHWVYYRDWRLRGTLRCAKEQDGCPATIKFAENRYALLTQEHWFHRPEPYLMEEVGMVEFIETQARTTNDSSKKIFTTAEKMYPNAAGLYISQSRCDRLVNRKRAITIEL